MHLLVSRFVLGLTLVILSAMPQSARAQVIVGAAVNAASFTRQELPNGKLAQGVMFTLFGQGMGPAELAKVGYFRQDTLPAGTGYISDTSGLSVITGSNTITWDVGSLTTGGSGGTFDLILSTSFFTI